VKIGVGHSRYLANKVAIELSQSSYASFPSGIDKIIEVANSVIYENLKREKALEDKVRDVIYDMQDEIDDEYLDERELFRMIKKRLAPEYDVILQYEDRFFDLAHTLLDTFLDKDLIEYRVDKVRVKNVIYEAMEEYIENRFQIEDKVLEKIDNYKKKLIPGTDEYQVVYDRLYEEELRRSGAMV
jgi:hypothetical protein